MDKNSMALVKEHHDLFSQFKNKTVVITGATGLLGKNIILTLLQANEQYGLAIHIVAVVRNKDKAMAIFGQQSDNIEYLVGDIQEKLHYQGTVDYIIHGASVTDSKMFVEQPVDTIETAIYGTNNVLAFSREKQVKGFVYLSSLEVYGIITDSKEPIKETDFGYLDPTAIRSSYSESKKMVECLVCSYGSQYDVPVKIARLTQTFGPGVSYDDNRVFAQFARAVINHEAIVLNTTGETVRNYCDITDAVSAILKILVLGEPMQAYNVANKNTTISIRDMAKMVAQLANPPIDVIINQSDAQQHGYNPTINMPLDTTKLESLGWRATTSLREMYERLIEDLVAQKP